jgi:hypothetical protein
MIKNDGSANKRQPAKEHQVQRVDPKEGCSKKRARDNFHRTGYSHYGQYANGKDSFNPDKNDDQLSQLIFPGRAKHFSSNYLLE